MASDFFSSSTPATSPCVDSDVSCKQSTLVRNEIQFVRTNLSEACIDEDFCYGFLDGTEEQKERFIEQFSSLNSTCFVRSETDIKGRSQKSLENGTL